MGPEAASRDRERRAGATRPGQVTLRLLAPGLAAPVDQETEVVALDRETAPVAPVDQEMGPVALAAPVTGVVDPALDQETAQATAAVMDRETAQVMAAGVMAQVEDVTVPSVM